MTLAIDRNPIRTVRADMGPDVPVADETCRQCGSNNDVTYVGTTEETIPALGEHAGRKHCWHCHRCARDWTTPVNPWGPCPDGLMWCERHETDDTEEYHGGSYVEVIADRSGPRYETPEALIVTCSRSDVAGVVGEAMVHILPGGWPGSTLLDAIGFTPAAARALADALNDAADAADLEAVK